MSRVGCRVSGNSQTVRACCLLSPGSQIRGCVRRGGEGDVVTPSTSRTPYFNFLFIYYLSLSELSKILGEEIVREKVIHRESEREKERGRGEGVCVWGGGVLFADTVCNTALRMANRLTKNPLIHPSHAPDLRCTVNLVRLVGFPTDACISCIGRSL
jgi:hypothetical protein